MTCYQNEAETLTEITQEVYSNMKCVECEKVCVHACYYTTVVLRISKKPKSLDIFKRISPCVESESD